jgi:hypothetical protein
MAITHPVCVYAAESNIEAEMICAYLEQNGIDAYPGRDDSLAGYWMFGTLPQIYKPKVWIDQSKLEAAQPLLIEYEREAIRRRATPQKAGTGTIEVICEECGKSLFFDASKKGTVQDCSHCGAFVDVGEVEPFNWNDS